MNLTSVIAWLQDRIGLDADSLGTGALVSLVAARMRALGLTDVSTYTARVADSPAEFELLVEAVLVPETWFFRGSELFTWLAAHIRESIRLRPDRGFRVLCVPCSTGEEPYSLAMALHDAGVPADRWSIDAIDLSRRSLEHAGRARYSEFAFRQTPPELRQRWFQPVAEGWQLSDVIRSAVRFQQGNLIEAFFLATAEPFQLILCRNVFIYLTAQARRTVVGSLARLLAADGLLGVGHADAASLPDGRFERAGPDALLLFRRAAPTRTPRPNLRDLPSFLPPPKQPPLRALFASARKETVAVETLGLNEARQLADVGRLPEAQDACQRLLDRGGPSAEVYTLLGVIHQARQDVSEAMGSFQKALYLQPDHRDALLHLMLLHEQRGELSQANLLRRRLERVPAGGET